MKRISIAFLFVCTVSFFVINSGRSVRAAGGMKTGFFLSLGQIHYKIDNFSQEDVPNTIAETSDFFLGASLCFKNRFELNLVYNRALEEVVTTEGRIAYDRDGFGLELGKVISFHLFSKGGFNVSAEVVGGGFYYYYPKRKIRPIINSDYYQSLPHSENVSDYQTGFYWTIRLKYRIAKKASLDVGFKSLLPVQSSRSLEYGDVNQQMKLFLFKSFFIVGISF